MGYQRRVHGSRRMRASGLVVLALFSASTLGEEDGFKSSSMAEKISHSSSHSSSSSSSSSASSASLTQGSSMSAMQKSAAGAVSSSAEIVDNRLHPAHEEFHGCQYVGEWGDCDPFKMIRIKEERLVLGDSNCVDKKNTTQPCSRDDLPPGTMWLIREHKPCVLELQKLKTMIEDLHRYIDLIHQRGQALFNAYNELRKRLLDIRRELTIIGQRNHDAEQTINRLRKETDDWKTKTNKLQMELNQLKAQYKGMEIKVRASKVKSEELNKKKDELSKLQSTLTAQFTQLAAENRDLKTTLLDAERYKEELRDLLEVIVEIEAKIEKTRQELTKAKEKLRMQLAMPSGRQGRPKINKDTKVNLDMSMWITHNITKEEAESYEPEIKYGVDPSYKYEEPKYEEPKYEEPKYEEPKNEAKYVEAEVKY